jgi:hypothetical protein
MTLTWDSLAGRDYQLQLLTPTGWTNASTPPVRATGTLSTLTFPLPANPSTLYRIVLLGF